MLTLFALSAVLMQESPAPPDAHARVMVIGPQGSLDADGDGQVTREEFTAPMTAHFARLDRDGDGRLSAGELSGARGGDGGAVFFHGAPDGEGDGHRFELRHPGPDGEVREIVRRGPAVPGTHIIHRPGHGEAQREMDKDGDDRISEAEFTGPLREAFARMDADRSGFIEEGERGGDDRVRVFTHRLETRDED
ncbi:MAG: hypothetical protein IR159_04185 [Brevundimonas sp.]|nr:hypothetical protein [Brevundimonas sp.]